MSSNKSIFLGIDQTGAVNSKGRPRPLPTCVLKNNQLEFTYLKSFSSAEVLDITSTVRDLIISIDCVLGLPKILKMPLRRAILKTATVDGYGRKPAMQFFRELGKKQIYRRDCELRLNANSVFLEHPFQKNIQTGTFRFWKDMSQDPNWFYIPWVEKKKNSSQTPVYEGYPSFIWKHLLKSPQRRPEDLKDLFKKYDPKIKVSKTFLSDIRKDPNLADAAVLAIAARDLTSVKPKPNIEGHILGDH